MKKKNTIYPRLIAYASTVLDLCESIPPGFANEHLRKQLIRSSTSSALNYAESQGAESTADFIHKLSLSLKELRESMASLQLLKHRASLREIDFSVIMKENDELIAILVTRK
jgi:four helix bundle protein